MVSEFIIGIGLGVLVSIVANIWVTEMYRFIEKKQSLFKFKISTITVVVLLIIIFLLGLNW